jgi:hypothetical protein
MITKKRCLEQVSRLSVIAITLALLIFVVIIAQVIATQLWWLYRYEKPVPLKFTDRMESPEQKIQKASKMFLPDGTLHLVRITDMQSYNDNTKEEITDVNGNILWQGIRKDKPFEYLSWASQPVFFNGWSFLNIFLLSPDLSGVLEIPVRNGQEVKEVWRYNFEAQIFEGYDIESGPDGYLGADGYVSERTQVKPLGECMDFTAWTDENPSSVIMLWQTKRKIYQIDFQNRIVEKVFESAANDINYMNWHSWRPQNPKDQKASDIHYRPLLVCQTKDNKYHLIMREPNQILAIDLPEQWQKKVNFTATSNAIFVKYNETNYNPPQSPELAEQYNREYFNKPQPQSVQLYKVVDNGTLTQVSRFGWMRPVPDINAPRRYNTDQWWIYQKWVSKTSPPMFDLVWYLCGDTLDKLHQERIGMMKNYIELIMQFRPSRTEFRQFEQTQEDWSPTNCLLSAVMMGFALWHGFSRRTSWPKLISWLVLVGLFNLAGFLTYLALNHTSLIKCPACGKRRGLEMDNCVQCGSPLPIPQRKPTDLIMA